MMKKLHKNLLLTTAFAGLSLTSYAQTGLHFDGVNDYVQATTTPVSGNGERTIEAWIKTTKNSLPANSGGDGQSVICDWGTASSGGRSTFNILWNNSIRFETAGGGVSGSTAVNDGLWHHVAVVYDPTEPTTSRIKLYIDGDLDAQGNANVNTGSSVKFKLGARVDGLSFFEGDMDEVRVWDVALTQDELESRMNVELCGYESGLVIYFPFNEGTPGESNSGTTTIYDLSVSEDMGTLHNFALTGDTSNFEEGHGLVSLDNGELTALQDDATYQWVDVDNDNEAIDGATSQSYSPDATGNYAVEITVGSCVITSETIAYDAMGLEDVLLANMHVYPNPTTDKVQVSLDKTYDNVAVELVSITGQTVAQYQFKNANEFSLDLQKYNTGLYFLKLKAGDLNAVTVKVVKN